MYKVKKWESGLWVNYRNKCLLDTGVIVHAIIGVTHHLFSLKMIKNIVSLLPLKLESQKSSVIFLMLINK